MDQNNTRGRYPGYGLLHGISSSSEAALKEAGVLYLGSGIQGVLEGGGGGGTNHMKHVVVHSVLGFRGSTLFYCFAGSACLTSPFQDR